MAMGGARMAFCGQFSMCLYAVMCYRFPPEPCCLRAYVSHATRYSYLYSELCEINPPSLRTSSLLFYILLLSSVPFYLLSLLIRRLLLYSASLDFT